MKNLKPLLIFTFCLFAIIINSQNILYPTSHPDTLWSNNDTFFINSPIWESLKIYTTIQSDTSDMGTTGFEGSEMTVWTNIDTLTIPYVNSPDPQKVYIPISSKNGTTILQLRFQGSIAIFSEEYIKKNRQKVSFAIPETYELANIILSLSECSKLTENRITDTEYAKLVNSYFSPMKNHPLIRSLNNKCSRGQHWSAYYGFRENSMCYSFNDNDMLWYNTAYKHVMNDNSKITGGEFRNLLYLVQDFVNKSGFREFYKKNSEYYNHLLKRQKELQPIRTMWTWIEKEFPQRFDSYKIVFSPLISGSHSTQKYYKGFWEKPDFQECIMFVNSTEKIDLKEEYSELLKKGLMSGTVFTEIDHNYVNPTSDEHYDMINQLMKDLDFWATKKAQENYNNAYRVFNEYMTHALFCLYIKENFSGEAQKETIAKRIQLMERRGYPKFEQFNEIVLKELEDRNERIYDMYEGLIKKMKKIK